MIRIGAMLAILVAAVPAMAGQGAAAGCAAGLAPAPRAVYDASVAEVSPTTDLRVLLTSKTKDLVEAGKIPRISARDSARAAAVCLKLRQQAN